MWIWIAPWFLISSALGVLSVLGSAVEIASAIANFLLHGFAANWPYYRRAAHRIGDARLSDPAVRLAEIARRAGTNEAAMWAGIVAPLVIFAVAFAMAVARLGPR